LKFDRSEKKMKFLLVFSVFVALRLTQSSGGDSNSQEADKSSHVYMQINKNIEQNFEECVAKSIANSYAIEQLAALENLRQEMEAKDAKIECYAKSMKEYQSQ
jgi:hypothetical protein